MRTIRVKLTLLMIKKMCQYETTNLKVSTSMSTHPSELDIVQPKCECIF